VQRGNQVLERKIQPELETADEVPFMGWVPDQPLTVTELESNMPAAHGGLKLNDDVVALNGTPMRSIVSVSQYLQQNGAKPVDVAVRRSGQELHFTITPVQTEEGDKKRFRLGFRSEPVQVDKLPFAQALGHSVEENKKFSWLIVDLVHKMLEHKASIKQMEGPIGIMRATGEAAQQPGWTPLLGLMAMISLNLGVVNLLPIPILDGGLILLLIIEALMRRDISVHIKERIYQTAFVFLLLFFAVVIYNDIMKVLPGLSQRLP